MYHFVLSTDNRTRIQKLIKNADIHAVAGLLKLYFRELPEPLFTHSLYSKFVDGLGKLLLIKPIENYTSVN